MNLENASLIAQILASIAVIVSLVYVGVQIRQSTKVTMMMAAQNLQATFGKIEELMITDVQLSELILRGTRRVPFEAVPSKGLSVDR
jgi:hypothetical protein